MSETSSNEPGWAQSSGSGFPASDDLAGAVVADKYELVRLLGQGGMGAVYEGRNRATLKRVAVKLLYTDLGKNEEVVKRFFREAQASSIIESDYIVQVYDSGKDQSTGFPYMVMEMLQGEDLEQCSRRVGPIHPLAAAKIMLQATMGLAKAHDAGIVHRDIKPANLFLTSRDDGDVICKILDFGIAKVRLSQLSDTGGQNLTSTGSVLGTPLYMSPEQARGQPGIDSRSDVWSLGVVMFEILTGALPYAEATTFGDLLVSIITSELPLLQSRGAWIPPELAEIAHRAMCRDLDRRFKNAGEMRDAIAALVPDGPRLTREMIKGVDDQLRTVVAPRLELAHDGMLRATTKTGLTMATAPAKPPAKRSMVPVIAAVIGAGVLGVGAIGAFALTRNKPPPPPAPEVAVPVPAPTPVPTTPAQQPVQASGPVVKTFELDVAPGDAEAIVDGQKSAVKNGKVELSGLVGSAHVVKLRKDGKETESVIAITPGGLVPSKLELGKAAPIAAAGTPGGAGTRKPKPGPTDKPQTPPPAADTTAKKPNLVTDTGDFK
jgi:eukaryotic-like serine/threonine-protein kinase